MKRLLPMLGLLISLNCYGQFPEYSSNVTDLDIGSSLLIEKYDSKYPFILAYSQPSFWSKRQYNSVLTFDGKSWQLAKWSYEL